MEPKNFSARLTIGITVLFCIVLLALMIFAPKLLAFFFGYLPVKIMTKVLIAFYCCCPAGGIALFSIFRIMLFVIREDIFTEKTVFSIRLLSWCCLFVSVVCFIFGNFWPPLFIVAFAAVFMTLILHVLKNVMAKATEIKKENELTV